MTEEATKVETTTTVEKMNPYERMGLEEFKEIIIGSGVEEILRAKREESRGSARRLEERYSAVSKTPKEAMKTDPDWRDFVMVAGEYIDLENQTLPKGKGVLVKHFEKLSAKTTDNKTSPMDVLKSVWEECWGKEVVNRGIQRGYEERIRGHCEGKSRTQGIIEKFGGEGEIKDEEISRLLRHQIRDADLEIRKAEREMRGILIDVESFVKVADVATEIVGAIVKITEDDIKKLRVRFSGDQKQ